MFFVIAVIADELVLLYVRQRIARLTNRELLEYRIKKTSSYLYGIYVRALNDEINKRFGLR